MELPKCECCFCLAILGVILAEIVVAVKLNISLSRCPVRCYLLQYQPCKDDSSTSNISPRTVHRPTFKPPLALYKYICRNADGYKLIL